MHPMLRHPLGFRRDHRFTIEHASDYLDGDLDDAGRACVEHHARFCPRCHELLTSLRSTVAALRTMRTPADRRPPPDVAAGVIARLRTER